jgi:cytochrome c biogenesis protein CcdA
MSLLVGFAFLGGIVTVLSPCILPLLPVVLSGSLGGDGGVGRARPLGIITGFVASFCLFTLTLAALVGRLGLSPDLLRGAAAATIVACGAVLAVPALKGRFMVAASRLASRFAVRPAGAAARPGTGPGDASGGRPPGRSGGGYPAGLLVGASLGLVWTPCVGPIMASVITLALTSSVDVGAAVITAAYALGTAVPLLLIMLGGRGLLARVPFLTRHPEGVQRFFGVLMVVTAVSIMAGWDRSLQNALLAAFPRYGSGLTAIERQERVLGELERLETEATGLNRP